MPKISQLNDKVWTLQEASFNGRVPMPYLYRLCQLGKIVARKDASGRWLIHQNEFKKWLVGYRYRCRQPKLTPEASVPINEALREVVRS